LASAAAASERPDDGLSRVEGWWARHGNVAEIVYWGLHVACLLVFWVGGSAADVALLAATFGVRMFAITAGYHRYFAHRTFKTSRAFQFLLALVGCMATQKGPLWWSGHHREHHRLADRPGDIHSPSDGFYHAHQGWIFEGHWDATPIDRIQDFERYPELRWLNRWYPVPPALLAGICFAIGGFSGLLWGFVLSTVLLWHATYTVNSFAHRFGSRRFETLDTSRNNWWIALLTLGEGWHNNHHHYCASARQGFRWWEVDVSYYLLRLLGALRIVWDIKEPPAHVLARARGR
jgi:stearoyl-CoA desaturase (delta-9 desaturase)